MVCFIRILEGEEGCEDDDLEAFAVVDVKSIWRQTDIPGSYDGSVPVEVVVENLHQ